MKKGKKEGEKEDRREKGGEAAALLVPWRKIKNVIPNNEMFNVLRFSEKNIGSRKFF